MAPRRKNPSPPSSAPISVGNCEVVVQAKNFTTETNGDCVEIALSKTIRIRILVVGKTDERDNGGDEETEKSGNCYFLLANPKDSTDQTKFLLQEVLSLYMKELPAMNFAANTGKQSMFLQRCVANGKYCTLLLKSKDERRTGEVIAAVTYQIIPADTQYAEIPLAAVNSIFQRKGIGRLLYLELRERLQSVGVQTILCWGDKESEGFWARQGFRVIGEVAKNGRARKLPIKADVRKALSFPGGSSLMSSHILKDNSSESAELPNISLPMKPIQLSLGTQQLMHGAKGNGPSEENNQIVESGYFQSDILGTGELPVDGCQDAGILPVAMICSEPNASQKLEGRSKDGEGNFSCSVEGNKRRMWETSCSSLMSKKVKGTHSDHHLSSQSPNWTRGSGVANSLDRNGSSTLGNEFMPDTSLAYYESNDFGVPFTAKCYRIMLMNIADADKKSRLTKIIEDLGGAVASEGSVSTHVVTGQVRKTLNFCTALCSGAWVISSAWLKESFKNGRFVDERPFILNDEDYKTKYRTELKSAVLRAKANPHALLEGLDIWLATHVQPPIRTLSAIVKSAGANVIQTRNEVHDVSRTIFVACEEDMEEAVSALKLGIRTFSSDWLMNCIMKQELDLEAPQFAESL